jgi:hypothetical protein
MLTIFGTARDFRGHFEVIQRNAIISWTKLLPRPQILMMGNDYGTDKVCTELGLTHVKDLDCNSYGTPLFSSMIAKAEEHAQYDLILYVSTDIILFNETLKAARIVADRLPRFCAVVARRESEIYEPIDFSHKRWEDTVREAMVKDLPDYGKEWEIGGDFFLYRKGFWREVPPFAIGRMAVDNWIYYRTLSLGGELVDLSPVVTIVHQKHDHSHHAQGTIGVYQGDEAQQNFKLAGGYQHVFFITDATKILTKEGFKRPKLTGKRLKRLIATFPVLHPGIVKTGRLVASPRKLLQAIGRRIAL